MRYDFSHYTPAQLRKTRATFFSTGAVDFDQDDARFIAALDEEIDRRAQPSPVAA